MRLMGQVTVMVCGLAQVQVDDGTADDGRAMYRVEMPEPSNIDATIKSGLLETESSTSQPNDVSAARRISSLTSARRLLEVALQRIEAEIGEHSRELRMPTKGDA